MMRIYYIKKDNLLKENEEYLFVYGTGESINRTMARDQAEMRVKSHLWCKFSHALFSS